MIRHETQCILSTLKDLVAQNFVGYNEDKQTHSALCTLGANWLMRNKKCRAILVERGCAAKEMPDVLGFYYGSSYLIEAKASRSDFLSDKSKEFREFPEKGMGQYRYYICPKGLISPEELPEKWGLLYVSPKGIIKKIKEAEAFCDFARDNEFLMLTSALATPWKLFQHWSDSQIERLFRIPWMQKTMEIDVKLFCARLAANRIEPLPEKQNPVKN